MADAPAKPPRWHRADFRIFRSITLRYSDNDVYHHVNNTIYYSWIDTTVSGWLWENGLVVPGKSPVIGLAVSSACDFFESLAFPGTISCGLRTGRIGQSSVHYEVGIFREGASEAAAQGRFIHVYVDAATSRPVPLPETLRDGLRALVV
ncbi:MAG: acyl-CoA thioesterase [Beijerinckiaceae bacterium]